jgi:hypothetical protein
MIWVIKQAVEITKLIAIRILVILDIDFSLKNVYPKNRYRELSPGDPRTNQSTLQD